MNKPEKFKVIMEIDNFYCENLLKIFDKQYNKIHNKLYNRPIFFKEVECDFTVNRFKIENKKKYDEFIEISKNLLDKLKDLYGSGKFWNIQIAKMRGGGVILPHTDSGIGFILSHRIHIPLVTNENVIFKVDNEEFYFAKGNVYEINNIKEHSVLNHNPPDYNRIHLIFDYISSEYIQFIKEKKELIYS
jgi:aspartyl/asparaginyl beta-hydroxylase (cupin superfamily)